MPDSNKYVFQFDSDISGLLKSITTTEQAFSRMQATLGKQAGSVSKILGDVGSSFKQSGQIDQATGSIKNLGKEVAQTSTKVKLSNGIIGTYTETIKRTAKGNQIVTGSFKQANAATESYGEAINRLGKRALLTIPIWFLLRNAIQTVGKTLKDGLANIASFDKVLQKAKRNLSGSTTEIESNFKRLREEVTKLSLESGIAVEKITNAFQKFATVGFDFETALTGANVATKLAVTLFGDAEENANALARAFRVLVDNSKDSRSASVQLQEVGALLNNLWKDQAFEISEIAGALERFAPVAGIANLSMKETVQVLAALQTAGIRGTRAGRLLGTSMLQLNKNFNKIQSSLGLKLNPQLTSTLDRFLAVTRAIGELNKTDKLKASQAVQELFGGVRGGQVPQALVAVGDILNEVLSRTGDINQFNKDFESVSDTIGVLTSRFHNANREIGKALVSGIVGGDTWNDTLKNIVTTLEGLRGTANGTARILRSLFVPENRRAAIAGPLSSVINEWTKILSEDISKAQGAFNEAGAEVVKNIFEGYNKALNEQLSKNELQDLLSQLTTFDADFLKIDPKVYSDIVESTQEMLDNFVEINNEQAKSQTSAVETKGIYEQIISSRLKELQTQGYLNSEIIKAEQNLRKQFQLTDTFENSLERQLSLERAINEEKRLQSSLSSNTIKLYKIAQNQGVEVARKIGNALSGNIDFDTFIRRGGEAVDTFKKEFSSIFEQQQAIAFFQGRTVKGLNELRGGSRISIEEQGIRKNIPINDVRTQIRANRAEQQLISQTDVTVPVSMNINTTLDVGKIDEVQKQFVDKVASELPQAGSKLNQALTKAIYNKQTRSL